MLALSGTAAGAQRAQIRPTRVKEGGSDTAKRCFRGPHELAFIRSKIFIYPQFASSVAMLMYFVLVYPFESVKLTRIETFNEIISIFICYFMMCFTDWIPYA